MARAPRQPPRPQARRAQQKAGGRSLAPHPTGQPGQSARSRTTTTPPGVVATHLTQTSLAGPRTVMRPRQGALCRKRGGGRPVPPAPRSSRPQAAACVTCCVCPHGQTSKPFAGPRAQQQTRRQQKGAGEGRGPATRQGKRCWPPHSAQWAGENCEEDGKQGDEGGGEGGGTSREKCGKTQG